MGSLWMLVSIFTGTKTFIVWPYGLYCVVDLVRSYAVERLLESLRSKTTFYVILSGAKNLVYGSEMLRARSA
jgi:hypothetical protein